MPHLLRVAHKPAARRDDDAPAADAFPFSVPTIRTLVALDVGHPVTFFVGENGTGKSTLLEAIAIAAELPTVGSEDAARAGAQFVVATHSPILLAYPGARIVSFDAAPPAVVSYAELEHVRVTRDFLNDPERYLRHLAAESP